MYPEHIAKLFEGSFLTPQEQTLRDAILEEYKERIALEKALWKYMNDSPHAPFNSAAQFKEFLESKMGDKDDQNYGVEVESF